EEDRLQLRNAAIAALALPDLEVVKEWYGFPPESNHVAFDARFERYARADRKGNVSVRQVADDREIVRLSCRGPEPEVLLSDDGRLLAVCDNGRPGAGPRVRVWRLDGPEPVRIYETAADPGLNVWFSPDNRRLIYVSGQAVHVRELAKDKTWSWPLPA